VAAVVAVGAAEENRNQPPVGGRLLSYGKQWAQVTKDKFVLRTVESGYEIEFTGPYRLTREPVWTPVPRDPSKRALLEAEIASRLRKAAVRVVDPLQEPPGFFSTFFLTEKKSGGLRPILNLSPLNVSIKPKKFRQETLRKVMRSLGLSARRANHPSAQPPGDGPWAVSLDLKDAYFHVAVAKHHTRFLRFAYDGVCYEYLVLPFGLSTAPRTFTRVVRALAGYLRTEGVDLFQYLDDWLIKGRTYEECLRNRDLAYQWTVKVGFLINHEKSDWVPSTHPVFIGAILDMRRSLAYPKSERVTAIVLLATQMGRKTVSSAKQWQMLLGHMSSVLDLVPNARLHVRKLQINLNSQWNPTTDKPSAPVRLSDESRAELRWWTQERNLNQGMPFLPPDPQLTLVTDASIMGWGGHLADSTCSGLWSPSCSSRHINWLELQAVFLTLQHFQDEVTNTSVQVLTDNTTVVAYINHQGGTISQTLCELALEIWDWCLNRNIFLSAMHVEGEKNVLADALSRRKFAPTEWMLHKPTAKRLFDRWGTPQIDLFATGKNKQIPTFFARRWEPTSSGTNALAQNWSGMRAYAYPPISLLVPVLDKLCLHPTTEMLLIAPFWPSQPWFQSIRDLLVDMPLRLPTRKDLLKNPSSGELYPTPDSLRLTAWPLSASPSKRQVFLGRLHKLSHPRGDLHQDGFIMPVSTPTTDGVGTNVWIPLQPL